MLRALRTIVIASYLLMSMMITVQGPVDLSARTPGQDLTVDGGPFTRGGTELDYAIITTSALKEGFEPLADWRTRTGLRTAIYLLDGEGGILEGEGRDDAERLFNFIISLREEAGGSLRYVLLGGDSDQVPVRHLHAGASEWELDDQYLSDVYYSSPSTDWDRDDDGLYGEREDIASGDSVDLSFDLIVGRVPASTLEEAGRYSERVVSYESSPEPGPWTSRMVLASTLMDCPNVLNDPGTPMDEGYDDYKDNGHKAIINHTLQFLPRSLDLIEVHDHPFYEGMNYGELNDTLGFETLPDMISSGCSLFTFAGQSFYDVDYPVAPPLAYSLAQYIDPQGLARGGAAFGEALTYQDVLGLDNGNRLPLMYLSSCDSANFSDPLDRDLSNVVLAPEGGSICLIGSTGVSWRGEGANYSLGNWYLMSRFWQQFMGSGRPGEALYSLKSNYLSSRWDELATKEPLLVGLYAYNLIGDPALTSWVGQPLNVGTIGAPPSLRAGGEMVTVEVRTVSDTPLYDAEVSIVHMGAGEVFKGRTGPDGVVGIWTEFTQEGNAHISIRARNHVPYFRNITVMPMPPDLEVLNGSLQIGPTPLTEGKGAWMKAMIRNNGIYDIQDATVGIYLGPMGDGPDKWPEPLMTTLLDLGAGLIGSVSFNVTPDRSWKGVTVAVRPVEGEVQTSNNLAYMATTVNARPRFLMLPSFEIEEDVHGGGEFHLGSHVFDPDDTSEELVFNVAEGTPEWVGIERGEVLTIRPPENWSGTLRVGLTVSDGLADDRTTLQVIVLPVNDPPVIIGLPERVSAFTGQVFVLPLEVVDTEGDEVTVALSSTLSSLSYSGGSIRLLPSEKDVGTHPINITVSDAWGASTNYSMSIEVKAAGTDLFFEEPSVHLPPARVGSRYSYHVRVGGTLAAGARFQDNTSLFEIDGSTGHILFTPAKGDVGEHWVRITVASGNVTTSRAFILEVREETSGPSVIVVILVASLLLLGALLVAVLVWKGPRVGQYGIEE